MKAAQARVVLTGASGGIGAASAYALAEAGAAVMLVGRSPDKLVAARRVLQVALPTAQFTQHAADVTDARAVAALCEAARAWGANVLVNNAGVASFGALRELDSAHIERVIRTNLVAPMLLTQAMLPWFESLPRAQIIQVGSALGRLALPGYSVYSASKFGLRGFTEALRRELAGTAVTAHYLGPRSTRTAFNDAKVLAYNKATGTAMDEPDRVALALVALLESEAAERFVGFPECVAVRLNGLAPTLLDGGLRRHGRSVGSAAAPRIEPLPARGTEPAPHPAIASSDTTQFPAP